MQEYIDNLTTNVSETLAQIQQADWIMPFWLIIGGVFCSRLCASGGVVRRMVGLAGLAVIACALWRYVIG